MWRNLSGLATKGYGRRRPNTNNGTAPPTPLLRFQWRTSTRSPQPLVQTFPSTSGCGWFVESTGSALAALASGAAANGSALARLGWVVQTAADGAGSLRKWQGSCRAQLDAVAKMQPPDDLRHAMPQRIFGNIETKGFEPRRFHEVLDGKTLPAPTSGTGSPGLRPKCAIISSVIGGHRPS